jgi:hypothetical protein
MKLTKKELAKLITEEINRLDEDSVGAVTEEEATDPTQQYIDWIVAIQEAAKDALERLENGAEIWDAGVNSRLNQLAFGLTDEDFYHHFFR